MSASDFCPILAVTLGDPSGSGPELTAKALADPVVRECCRPVVIGDVRIVAHAAALVRSNLRVRTIARAEDARQGDATLDVLDLPSLAPGEFRFGEATARTGDAAYRSICRATQLVLHGHAHAMVTSAISKAALHAASHHYDGHTELLAELCGRPKVTMLLVAEKLRVAHVSTHVSLRQAIERVQRGRILEVIDLLHGGLRELGVERPRIGVAGLNPHAGEGGLFGDEEVRFIRPAIELAASRGLEVSGPHAGDTLFFRTLHGEFDGAVAMYHDQGHVAAKMLGIWLGVNVTLGLPLVRTSVEHGTDFVHAGTGRGDPRSLIRALSLAAKMAGHRWRSTGSTLKPASSLPLST